MAQPPPRHVPTVCQVLHTLEVGGAEILAARLARRLNGEFRFLFACLDALGSLGRELRDEGFTVEVLERRPGPDWRCARQLAGLVRQEHVDVLHAHQYTPFFYAAASRGLRGRPPVLFNEHGRHHPDFPRRKRMLANRLLLRGPDRVLAVGGAVRDALVRNEGIPLDRIEVAYNGVPLERFQASLDDAGRAAVRAELELAHDDFVLIQVARLDYLKDHATAVRTLARLVEPCPRARLLLVGDGPERGPIEALVREHGVAERVRLVGRRGDVPRLLAASDVVLLTSVSEGIPLTLIEAMAAERPVVSTRVGGVAEVVEDGQTGLLAPSGDDAALAERVLELAGDPARRDAMGRAGHLRAEALFSESRMHERYRACYEEMLADPPARSPRPAAYASLGERR